MIGKEDVMKQNLLWIEKIPFELIFNHINFKLKFEVNSDQSIF